MEAYNEYRTIPLEERIENAYKSENGLYPHEILVLSYAPKYSAQELSFSSFWGYKYGVHDVRAILDDLFERGFIKYANVEESVKRQKVSQIKEFLKNHGSKVTGNKALLIERVFKNFSKEEIEQFFTIKYYELTELGRREIECNQELIYIHDRCFKDLDIWAANQWMYENPGIPLIDAICEKLDSKLNVALDKENFTMYLTTVNQAIDFNMKNGRLEESLREIAHKIYFEINVAKYSQRKDFIISSKQYIFPYSTCIWKLSENVKEILANLKWSLHFDNDELIERLIELLNDVSLSFEIFTKREAALIAVYDMKNEGDEIEKIYMEAEKRIRNRYSDIKSKEALETENMPEELSEREKEILEIKQQILLDSFNILKNDIETNHEQLGKIMSQLQDSQPETVIDLWKFLLEANWNHIVKDKEAYGSISSYLTDDIMRALTDEDGFIVFEEYFVSEPKILQAVYQYSPKLPPWSTSVIATQIRSKQFETASTMLGYMYANKKNNFIKNSELCNYCFSSIYQFWIEEFITTSRTHYGEGGWQTGFKADHEIFEFLSYWVDQINDPLEKARTNVFLMELI